MKLHLLSPEVKCQTCGGELEFVRVRRFADLHQCARGAKVMLYTLKLVPDAYQQTIFSPLPQTPKMIA